MLSLIFYGVILIDPVRSPKPYTYAEFLNDGFTFSPISVLVSYVALIIYGLPVAFLLHRLQRLRFGYIVVAGLFPSGVFVILFPHAYMFFIAVAYFSLWVSVTCWFFAIWWPNSIKNSERNGVRD